MRVILDAMGGDNAPAEILKGAAQAVAELKVQVAAVGRLDAMQAAAKENGIDLTGIDLVAAGDTIEMCDDPTKAIRNKKDSSMVVGLRALAHGEGDAFVSAGSTGALLVGATLIAKRMHGVKRAALATVIPGRDNAYLLLDSGANVECPPEMLDCFATMGSVYAEKVLSRPTPTVALVNNGAEESKGTPIYVEAHRMMKNNPAIHFVGNIEPRDVPNGAVDVVVCDGFTGNVILKLTEGLAKFFNGELKKIFLKNTGTKLAALTLKSGVSEFKKKLDADEYGGAPLLGISKIVIKAHGSSNAKAIKNAIRQAKVCYDNGMIETIAANMAAAKQAAGDETTVQEAPDAD